MTIAADVVFFTSSGCFSPMALDTIAFSPTASPHPSAIMSICSGAAIEIPVSASSLTRETKILSTRL